MLINFVSDLHDDIAGNRIERMADVDCDATVVAGDAMSPGTLALRRLRELYPDRDRPLVYVPGNHDFYSHHDKRHPELKTTIERQHREMPEVAESLGIILLNDSAVDLGGVRVGGGTLWTELDARPRWMMFGDAARAASRGMNDYRLIKTGTGKSRDTLQPRATIEAHLRTVAFLESFLAESYSGETVVVTHHAPSYRSLVGWDPEHPQRFNELDWCYATDLERLMYGDNAPALWLHGHIHANRDYMIGHTRIVANPRGYPLRNGLRENPDFNPELVIEVERHLVPGMSI
jgi:Icc-related predicted phosphoesterase